MGVGCSSENEVLGSPGVWEAKSKVCFSNENENQVLVYAGVQAPESTR